jgi:fibronectin-binding autotransporter adhesin
MFRTVLVLFLLLLSPLWACAQIQWLNPTDGNFLTATNWAGGVTPTATDDVEISVGGTYTVTLSGSTTIKSLLLNNATTTFNQTSGTFTISNGFTYSGGIYNLSGGSSLTLGAGMTMSAGTMNIFDGSVINLTGSMNLTGGQINMSNGGVFGGSITGGGNRVKVSRGTFGGVYLDLNSLDLTNNDNELRLQGGTTFAANSVYATNGNIIFNAGQTALDNVTFNMSSSGTSYTYLQSVSNATLTLGATTTIRGSSGNLMFIGFGAANGNIINNGLIENAGVGDMRIDPAGTLTNNGTITATAGGFVIKPGGLFTNSASGTVNATGGALYLDNGPILNQGTINLGGSGTIYVTRPIAPTDLGTITRANPNSGSLYIYNTTMTLGASYNLTPIGTVILNGNSGNTGQITSGSGGPFSISTSNASRVKVINGVLDKVSVGNSVLDLSSGGNSLTLKNNTTFSPGSAYTTSGDVLLDSTQTSIGAVSLTFNSSYPKLMNTADNTTFTINSSGFLTVPSVRSDTGTSYLSIGSDQSGTSGTNRSVINGSMSLLQANNGSLVINPSGTFVNNGTVETIAGYGLGLYAKLGTTNSSTGTINATNGTVYVAFGPFQNNGTINISSNGTLQISRNVTPANLGTISRASPTTGTLNLSATLTLNGNYDLANLGAVNTIYAPDFGNAGTVTSGVGGPYTLYTTNISALLKINSFTAGTLDNVTINAGTLDLSANDHALVLKNNVTFEAGSAYTTTGSVYLDANQNSIGLVSFTFGNYSQLKILSNIDNSTITINPSGIMNVPSIRSDVGNYTLSVGNNNASNTGTNRSVINAAGSIIQANNGNLQINPSGTFVNNGIVETVAGYGLSINPAGSFTNNGIVRATAGTVTIAPGGAFVIGATSQLTTSGSGVIVIATNNVINAGSVTTATGTTLNVGTNTTTTYGNASGGTTSIDNGGTVNIGNSSASAFNNSGIFSIGSQSTPGGQLNIGPNGNPGLFTNNTGGIFYLDGTANTRVTVAGGTLTGSGTINALAGAGLVIGPNGTGSPGHSPGQIVIGGGLDVGGTLEIDIANGGGNNSNTTGSTSPGTGFDTFTVKPPPNTNAATDALVRATPTKFRLNTGNTSQSQFNGDSFWTVPQRWAFLRTTAANPGVIKLLDINGNMLSTVTNLVTADVRLFNANGTVEFDPHIQYPGGVFYYEFATPGDNLFAQQLDLVWSPVPVPEPATVLAIGAVGMVLAGMRKKSGRRQPAEVAARISA